MRMALVAYKDDNNTTKTSSNLKVPHPRASLTFKVN